MGVAQPPSSIGCSMVPPLCAAAFHGTNWHHVTPGAFAPLPTSLLSSDPEEAPGNVGERLGLYMYICILYIYIHKYSYLYNIPIRIPIWKDM